jgi:hypothetical protein
MNLNQLLSQGKVEPHNTSKKEINDLFMLVDRDIKDAKIQALIVRKWVKRYCRKTLCGFYPGYMTFLLDCRPI